MGKRKRLSHNPMAQKQEKLRRYRAQQEKKDRESERRRLVAQRPIEEKPRGEQQLVALPATVSEVLFPQSARVSAPQVVSQSATVVKTECTAPAKEKDDKAERKKWYDIASIAIRKRLKYGRNETETTTFDERFANTRYPIHTRMINGCIDVSGNNNVVLFKSATNDSLFEKAHKLVVGARTKLELKIKIIDDASDGGKFERALLPSSIGLLTGVGTIFGIGIFGGASIPIISRFSYDQQFILAIGVGLVLGSIAGLVTNYLMKSEHREIKGEITEQLANDLQKLKQEHPRDAPLY